MVGYTKLFSSILESTIWCENSDTRVVWITMLASADKHGVVFTSKPGLAKRANVSLQAVYDSLQKFTAPDPESRNDPFEGRRVEEVEHGWRILNYTKYRDKRDNCARREYMRTYMQSYRKNVSKNVKPLANVNQKLAQASSYIRPIDYLSKGGVTGGESNPSVNSEVNNPKPKPKTLKTCPIPECDNPVPAGDIYCCQLHKDYAERLLAKQNHGAS